VLLPSSRRLLRSVCARGKMLMVGVGRCLWPAWKDAYGRHQARPEFGSGMSVGWNAVRSMLCTSHSPAWMKKEKTAHKFMTPGGLQASWI
jgi:hypothetical protein